MAPSKPPSPPKDAHVLLVNLQDMFLSQIEPDVIRMIFVTCDYNVDVAIETLLRLVCQSRDAAAPPPSPPISPSVKKRQSVKSSVANTHQHYHDGIKTNGLKYDQLQTLNTVSDTARDSIYKSNEDLYFEELEGASSKGTTTTTTFGSSTKDHQFLTVLSPDSDRSIEGDASESITTMASTNNVNRKPQQHYVRHKKVAASGSNAQQNVKNPVTTTGTTTTTTTGKNFRVPHVRRASASEHVTTANLTTQQTKMVESLIHSFRHEQQKGPNASPLVGNSSNPVMKWKQQQQQQQSSFPAAPVAATHRAQAQFTRNDAFVKSQLAKSMTRRAEGQGGGGWANAVAPTPKLTPQNIEDDVLRRIKANQRVLILLRGCPGSGKTTLARKLKRNGVILSADSFFERNGKYEYDYSLIGEAHTETRDKALECMQNNVTPIIIDNTNLESWEMEPYVLLAIKLRYYVALLEPQTPWRYNAYHLVNRNSHAVPYNKLRSMIMKFDHDVTVNTMLRKIGPKIDMHKQKMVLKEQKQLHETLGGILSEAARRTSVETNTVEIQGKQQTPVKQQKKNKDKKAQSQENSAEQSSGEQLKEMIEKLRSTDGNLTTTEQSATKKPKKKAKNKTLSKSCSVPNIAEMSNDANPAIKHYDLISVGGDDQSLIDSDDDDKNPGMLSQNMKDLMLIDFGMEFVPPHERDPFGDDVSSMDGSLSDTLLPPMKSHRLAAQFANEWDLPPYPVEENKGELRRNETAAEKATATNSDAVEDFVRFDDDDNDVVVGSPSISITSSNEHDDAKIVNLKTYFPSVPNEDLRDLMEKCDGNVEWVANLLLDSGYECSMDVKDGELEESIEGMADLGSENGGDDSDDNGKSKKPSEENDDVVRVFPSSPHEKYEPPQELVLRIDPIFAMQLEKVFGPVTFHVASESYYGNDLNVNIDLETARDIHRFWSQTLMKKFEREESTLNEIMKDEGYAKEIQAMEDARLAANLEASDRRDPNFPPLPNEALILGSNQKLPTNTEGLASKIKRQQLYEMFPKIDRKAVDEVFNANDGSFLETVNSIETTFCPNEPPQLVIAPELISEYENAWLKIAQQESQTLYEKEKEKDDLIARQAVVDPSYEDLRAEATVHYHRRQDCFERAQDAYGKNMKAVASFYSQQGHLHSQKLHEANKRAMEIIMSKKNSGVKSNTLDLHMLFVHEAMEALSQFINKKKVELRSSREPSLTFYVITGKGTHSNQGQPRIKPAVVDFLNRQNYSAYEANGGVIEVRLTQDDIR